MTRRISSMATPGAASRQWFTSTSVSPTICSLLDQCAAHGSAFKFRPYGLSMQVHVTPTSAEVTSMIRDLYKTDSNLEVVLRTRQR